MLIRLLSEQVPAFWETIKFVAVNADEVGKKDLPSYLNELLHALLSDKAQCFVRLDGDRKLLALTVTRVLGNKVNGDNYLLIQCVYSFQAVDADLWKEDREYLENFARASNCKYISFNSRNEKIWKVGEHAGFREVSRTYQYQIV
jgi:hypothetical protein